MRLEYVIAGDNGSLQNAVKQSIGSLEELKRISEKLKIDFFKAGSVSEINKVGSAIADVDAKMRSYTKTAIQSSQAFKDQQIQNTLDKLSAKLLVVNGNTQLFGNSLKNSQNALRAYQGAFDSLLSQGVSPLDSRVQTLRGHIDDLNKTVNDQKNSNKSGGLFGGGIGGQLAGVIAGYTSLFAVIGGVSKVVTANAEISDSLADVRRTAGLTAVEAEALSESLKKIDTRTSLKGLIDIAVIGGQLGIAKDQLAGFTKAIDQLSVTLSGEISGGAEAVATSLGKINGVFKTQQNDGTTVEEAFNKTGSAILALGQAGLATGQFLQDFSLRVAGVAKTAKIGLPTVLAYSAVLEESGSSAEVAGTAFNKLVGNLAAKRNQFLAIAQIADSTLTLKSFTELINTDANSALQKFFAGLNAGGKDLTSFTDLIGQIGLKGGPAKNAVIALAQNQGLLNERIAQSTKAYNDGTLAAEQFAIKNNTLGASIDKLGNAFTKATSSGAISAFFKQIVDGATNAITELDKLFNSRSLTELLSRTFVPGGGAKFDAKNSIGDNFFNSQIKEIDAKTTGVKAGGNANDVIPGLNQNLNNPNVLKKLIQQYTEAGNLALDAKNQYVKAIESNSIKDGDIKSFTGETVFLSNAEASVVSLRKKLKIISDAYVKARDNAAKIVKPVSPTITPTATTGQEASGDTLSNQLSSILNKGAKGANTADLTGYALQVQEINNKYKDLNTSLDEFIKKVNLSQKSGKITEKTANGLISQATTGRTDISKDKDKELSAARITEAQRVSNEIQRINDSFGVKSTQNREKELAEIEKMYNSEVAKAQGNSEILKALDADRLVAKKAINDKYALIEEQLMNDIDLINNQALATQIGKEESQSAKIAREWEERRKSANKYYDELVQLALTDIDEIPSDESGFNQAVKGANASFLKNGQATVNKNITNATDAEQAKINTKPLTNGLQSALRSFSQSFYSTLTDASTYTKGTFSSIFSDLTSKLTTSLNQVFLGVVVDGLSKAISSGTSSLFNSKGGLTVTVTGAAVAGAGLLGGIVSASSPKTSSVGQTAGGALSGAAAGAAIGSLIPGGIVIGAIAGGLIGAISGIFGSKSARDEQRKLEQAQLDEEKKQTDLMRQNALAFSSSIIGRMTDQGIVTGVDVNAFGKLTATVSGKDLQFILDRNAKTR